MGNRIYLRALEPDDYKTSIKWRQDEEIWDMVGGPRYFVSSEYEKKWVLDAINSTDKLVLAICLLNSGKYIGNITLQAINMLNRSARMPILIGDKSEWNKGYGTEAIMMMLEYAFLERNLNRIFSHVLEGNINSVRMHEKCGYVREGTLRQSVYKNGEYKDQILMSVLKADFLPILENYKERFLSKGK